MLKSMNYSNKWYFSVFFITVLNIQIHIISVFTLGWLVHGWPYIRIANFSNLEFFLFQTKSFQRKLFQLQISILKNIF